MKKGEKFQLSSKWWSSNKAKTVKDPGLGKALEAYEKAAKDATLQDALKALDKVEDMVKAAIKACGGMQAETEEALETAVNKAPKVIPAERQRLEKLLKDRKAEVNGLTVERILKTKPLLDEFSPFCKKALALNDLAFVLIMQRTNMKGNQAIYDKFISDSGSDQVNLSSELRRPLDEAAMQGNWTGKPWADAYASVLGDLERNQLGPFKNAMLKQLGLT
jgi:hypothetical protein